MNLSSRANPEWPLYRKFVIDSIVRESETSKSFYMVPVDGGPLMPYLPGQHLPLRLEIPGRARPLTRCYTLSDCYRGTHYRLTIKREDAPPHLPDAPSGLSSSYIHDHLREGDIVEARIPSGGFYLEMEKQHPVVMIAGGIGVTPIMSMLNAVDLSGKQREIYVVFALQHGGHHVFKNRLQELRSVHQHLHVLVLYEHPRPEDRLGSDFDAVGRVDKDLLERFLPSLHMEYYVCGPPGMMQAVLGVLRSAGVPDVGIHTESFGPASTRYSKESLDNEGSAGRLEVRFLRSGITAQWADAEGTLLDLAEKHGVDIPAGCRYGDCATCLTSLLSGRVAYLHATGVTPEPGTCLPCSCKPESAIELDA